VKVLAAKRRKVNGPWQPDTNRGIIPCSL
jgi:hypothetical protein